MVVSLVVRARLIWCRGWAEAFRAVPVGSGMGSVAQLAMGDTVVVLCRVGESAIRAAWFVGLGAYVLAMPNISAALAGLERATERSATEHFAVKLDVIGDPGSPESQKG